MSDLDLGSIGQLTKKFKSSSAAVPGLILAALSIPVGLIGSVQTDGNTSELFSYLAMGGFVLPALQIAFFTLFDRDRLQNEEHVEKKLMIAAGKGLVGDRERIVDLAADAELIDNPLLESEADA